MRRLKLPVTIHQARLGPVEFKVIRPAEPPVRAVLLDRDRSLDTYLDQDAAYLIGGLWLLAASSPRSVIHLPMRGNRAPRTGGRKPGHDGSISCCCTTRSSSRPHAGRNSAPGSARGARGR